MKTQGRRKSKNVIDVSSQAKTEAYNRSRSSLKVQARDEEQMMKDAQRPVEAKIVGISAQDMENTLRRVKIENSDTMKKLRSKKGK